MSFWDSFYFCRKKRPIVQPNPGFMKQLQEYEKDLTLKKLYEMNLTRSVASAEQLPKSESMKSTTGMMIVTNGISNNPP